WLSFYPLAFIALVLMLRQHTAKFSVSLWLDGIVGGLASASIAAAAILKPVLATSGGSIAAVVTTTAYPLLDILLLLVVVATLAALALLVRGHLHPVATGLAAGTVLAALGRLVVTFREATALADSRQLALTDDLTGLANRRALYVHSRRLLADAAAGRAEAAL